MSIIDIKLLEEAVYNLCLRAGQELSPYPYTTILQGFRKTNSLRLAHILQNAENAHNIKRPLCQDTGMVHIFLEVGNEISFSSNPTAAINDAVAKCYTENYFRKSTVENGFISGKNREDNTPAVIHIDYVDGNRINIKVLLKGAGCDNVSTMQMLLPSTTEDEFVDFCSKTILEKGKNACPPVFVSIAVGGGAENVMTEAEKAFFTRKNDLPQITNKIRQQIEAMQDKKYEGFYLSDIFITTNPHHMASLPVAIAFNCHSLRIAEAEICDNKITYSESTENFENIALEKIYAKEVRTDDIETVRNLKEQEDVLLSGEILIARDAAHKKMLEYKQNGKELPFEIANKMIFYAAPCPPAPQEIVGPIGPTTAHRMDKFLSEFPQVLATLGKGPRSYEAQETIRKNKYVYFEIEGGIATLLASCFKSCTIIAFEELFTEAVYLAKVEKLPAKVVVSANK